MQQIQKHHRVQATGDRHHNALPIAKEMALADIALETVLKLTHIQRLFDAPFAAKRRLELIPSGTGFRFSFNTKCEDQVSAFVLSGTADVRTFRTAPLALLTRDGIIGPAESAGRLDIASA